MSQLQFELWEECNSKCKFCYLGERNCCTPNNIKIDNINKTLQTINSIDFIKENIDCLGYIGGEFFQGLLSNFEVHCLFMKLIEKTNNLLKDNIIKNVWISATLTIGDQLDLYEALSKFDDLSKVWILTSYDTIGRFHSETMKAKWISNLIKLRQYSTDININITSILTGDFIDKYLMSKNEIFNFIKQNNCSLYLKPTCQITRSIIDNTLEDKKNTNIKIPNFFPTRKQFLSFLCKYKQEYDQLQYDKLFNMNLRADWLIKYSDGFKLSHRIKSKYQEQLDSKNDIMMCGHSSLYRIYLDDNVHCAICDKLIINNMF